MTTDRELAKLHIIAAGGIPWKLAIHVCRNGGNYAAYKEACFASGYLYITKSDFEWVAKCVEKYKE